MLKSVWHIINDQHTFIIIKISIIKEANVVVDVEK